MLDQQNIQDVVQELLVARLPEGNLTGFSASMEQIPFVQLGLDSVQFIEMLVQLEEIFGITIDDEDLLPENFQNLAQTVSYISRKKKNG